ncbi:MAG: DUF3237 domain-containing protein [Dehalococcoidia bacterium]|nr:DUF3237 domain-containing protein [Dehalococcoidia bacterium]MCA9844563.1 DUF3237 domain-containing protein [Dehalococcoidia bacterium]MCA9852415.1 DUF3237 domain-containing protein [Dehalococcoidia bacterium]
MNLQYLMTYRADLREATQVGKGPWGTRHIIDVLGGTFEGPKLQGTILPSGADWLVAGDDGVVRLDVRVTLKTNDGAHLYIQYHGINIPTDTSRAKRAAGEPTEFGDAYFMTSPRIETGDERYAWLNSIVTVAEGRTGIGWVEYRVYELVN